MSRTGSSKMYLVTLDESVSDNVLDILYESNIIIVTTAEIKVKAYPDSMHVISFEKLIRECKRIAKEWKDYNFSEEERHEIIKHLIIQQSKHENHSYIDDYYESRIREFRL